jgi:hypothetical protein
VEFGCNKGNYLNGKVGRKKEEKRRPHTHFMKMRKYINAHTFARVFLRVSRRALRVYNVNNYAAAVAAVAAKARQPEREREKKTFL